jgi:hypothetical protein
MSEKSEETINKKQDRIWGSHGGDYEGDRPDDGGSKDLWNVGKLLPDYTVLQPRRQQSSRNKIIVDYLNIKQIFKQTVFH